jgi:hypothetical protein
MPHADWLLERYKAYIKNVNINGNENENLNDNKNQMPFDLTLCE